MPVPIHTQLPHLPLARPDQATSRGPEVAPEVESAGAGVAPTSFADRVSEVFERVDGVQKAAEAQSTDFAAGRSNDIHGTMIGLQQADISLRFAASLRNRVLEAYREVMRMGG